MKPLPRTATGSQRLQKKNKQHKSQEDVSAVCSGERLLCQDPHPFCFGTNLSGNSPPWCKKFVENSAFDSYANLLAHLDSIRHIPLVEQVHGRTRQPVRRRWRGVPNASPACLRG